MGELFNHARPEKKMSCVLYDPRTETCLGFGQIPGQGLNLQWQYFQPMNVARNLKLVRGLPGAAARQECGAANNLAHALRS